MEIRIGERLLELRTQKQMTQEELAEQLGVARQSVSKWESNGTFPNMNKLLEICEIFQVSLDYLLRGVGEAQAIETGEQKTMKETPAEHPEKEIPGERRKGSLYIKLCMVLVGILFFISFWLLGSVLVNHVWNTGNKVQDLMHVDTVYEQYTKAKVSVPMENGTYVEQVLWLDTDGVRENDWVFCYTDADRTEQVKVKYGGRTILLTAGLAVVFILIFILLWLEYRREYVSKEE